MNNALSQKGVVWGTSFPVPSRLFSQEGEGCSCWVRDRRGMGRRMQGCHPSISWSPPPPNAPPPFYKLSLG